MNLTKWVAGSTSAAESDRPEVGTAAQVVPSDEYCHAPCAAVAALPVTATPAKAVASAPSRESLKFAAKSDATDTAGGESVSSPTAASVALPLATGRSLTAVMLVDSGTVPADQFPAPPIWPLREAEVLKAGGPLD